MKLQHWILTLTLLSGTGGIRAQDDKLTAMDIVQRSIDSTGGDRKFDTVNTGHFVHQLLIDQRDTISLIIKKKGFNKYWTSTLSIGYVNTTTIYNNGRAVIIKNDTVREISDPLELETLAFSCYISTDYAYKKLGYKLTRLDDQKFENFDCYTVLAESPLGQKVLNYYDKKKGKLLMIIYPSGNRTINTEYFKNEGLSVPVTVLISSRDKITWSRLEQLDYEQKMDTGWFNLPGEGSYKAPVAFRTGTFSYITNNWSGKVVRDDKRQVETIKDTQKTYQITWTSDNDYLIFRLKNSAGAPTNDNIEYKKCRIITWTGNKYYCQFLTSAYEGGTAILEKSP